THLWGRPTNSCSREAEIALSAAEPVAGRREGRVPRAVGLNVRMTAGIIVQQNIRTKTGRAGDRAAVERIFADHRQQPRMALALIDEGLRIGMARPRRAPGRGFPRPNESF